MDAILAELEKGDAAVQRNRARCCALITIDVKNAFNSASWEAIAAAVERMKIPPHLCRLLRNYFDGRVLQYDMAEGVKTTSITAGVPQRKVLGPTLWNVLYDGILTLALPLLVSKSLV